MFSGRVFIKMKFICSTPNKSDIIFSVLWIPPPKKKMQPTKKQSLITSVKDITVVIKLELNEIKKMMKSEHALMTLCSSFHHHHHPFVFIIFILLPLVLLFLLLLLLLLSFYDDMDKECVHLNKQ